LARTRARGIGLASGLKLIIISACAQKADALKHVSEELRANKDFMLDQVLKDPKALKYAGWCRFGQKQILMSTSVCRLHAITPFVGLLLQLIFGVWCSSAGDLKNDYDLVMTAVKKNGLCLELV
jgi:hypothetical protein